MPLELVIVPAVTEPVLPLPQVWLHDKLVAEQAPITRTAGSVTVSVHVAELQLSLAVNVYVPGAKPVTVAVVPTTVPDEFFHE